MFNKRYNGRVSCLSLVPIPKKPACLTALSARTNEQPLQKNELKFLNFKDKQIIEDQDLNRSIMLSSSSFINLDDIFKIDILPPLPLPNQKDFAELFLKKVKICKTLCLFDGSPADKKAINQKTITLQQFINFYEVRANGKKIDENLHCKLIDAMESNISHPIQEVDPRLMYYDKEPQFVTDSLSHIELCYKLLKSMYCNISEKSLFTQDFYFMLMNMINSPDIRERNLNVSFLKMLLADRKSLASPTLTVTKNYITDFLDGARSVFCITPSLDILSFISTIITPQIEVKFNDIILNAALLLIHSHLYCMFHEAFENMCIAYTRIHSRYAYTIIVSLLQYWPETHCMKEFFFVQLINKLIPKVNIKLLSKKTNKLLGVLSNCAAYSSHNVSMEAMNIYADEKMKAFIFENQISVLNICTYPLVKASRTHWDALVRAKATASLKILQELNKHRYAVCLNEAEERLSSNNDTEPITTSQWNIIIEAAKKNDSTISNRSVVGKRNQSRDLFKPMPRPKLSNSPMLPYLRKRNASSSII